MPYIYVLNGRHRHKVFQLGEEPEGLVIGQRDDAGVVLKDPWISWTHAKVVREDGGFAIEDLGSTNGTYVNCEKVTRRSLADDDVVFLGRTHLLFVASARPPSAPPIAGGGGAAGLEAGARLVIPGMPQDLPALEVSQDSALGPPSGDEFGIETTRSFAGPFARVGRIAELEIADEDEAEAIPLPPAAEFARPDAADAGEAEAEVGVAPLSDDHIEIDIEELGLGPEGLAPAAAGQSGIGDAIRVHSIDGSLDFDPVASRDREIARLCDALAARDAEILRLRAELTKLKEQYLDL